MKCYPYFSPENRLYGEVSRPGDIYCLGLLLLELLGGVLLDQVPNGELWQNYVARFTAALTPDQEAFADTRVSWDAREAGALARLAARCLARDPKDRPVVEEMGPILLEASTAAWSKRRRVENVEKSVFV